MTINTNELPEIEPGTLWRHCNGIYYFVLFHTNVENDKAAYPLTVVYANAIDGNRYSRRADDWHRSMTKITRPPEHLK